LSTILLFIKMLNYLVHKNNCGKPKHFARIQRRVVDTLRRSSLGTDLYCYNIGCVGGRDAMFGNPSVSITANCCCCHSSNRLSKPLSRKEITEIIIRPRISIDWMAFGVQRWWCTSTQLRYKAGHVSSRICMYMLSGKLLPPSDSDKRRTENALRLQKFWTMYFRCARLGCGCGAGCSHIHHPRASFSTFRRIFILLLVLVCTTTHFRDKTTERWVRFYDQKGPRCAAWHLFPALLLCKLRVICVHSHRDPRHL